ncbi:hypothetical protein KFK09_010867 [Dendrobium nobile]|uniref:Retroviral polymerase SH3-like domain-containing protein n=1 Tax=Dendrobium nobile TaxID=94219 RepID=A0A8T3BB82_DENNO|nr:hypothetical protein KFK09_010867 [Dendrobium nobile]
MRTLLQTASVPYHHWPEAALTAAYLINRMPSKTTSHKSPFQLLFNKTPSYSHLRVFGCECFPLLPPSSRHKLQSKANSNIFLGYSDTYKGYKSLDPLTNKVTFSRHITFNENSFPFSNQPHSILLNSQSIPSSLLIPTSLPNPLSTAEHVPCPIPVTNSMSFPPSTSPPMSQQEPQPSTQPRHSMVTRSKTGHLKPINRLTLLHQENSTATQSTPTSYTEAAKHF